MHPYMGWKAFLVMERVGGKGSTGVGLHPVLSRVLSNYANQMIAGRPSSLTSGVADNVCLRDLALIESSYGKLVYLASLIDANSGCYEHYDSKGTEVSQQSHQILKRRHEDLFREWILFPLERKMAEVQSYIAGLGPLNKVQLLDAWLRLAPYKNLVPASVQGPERHKHVSDFEAILGLLRNVYGVAAPDRI